MQQEDNDELTNTIDPLIQYLWEKTKSALENLPYYTGIVAICLFTEVTSLMCASIHGVIF